MPTKEINALKVIGEDTTLPLLVEMYLNRKVTKSSS